MLKPKREKKCKQCKSKFKPYNTTQVVCSPKCALMLVEKQNKKAFNAETRKRKAKLKSRADWLREAQQAFNAFIRVRDHNLPCVSCGKPNDGSHQRHASHLRSVGAATHLRFNLFNVNASCAQCNNIKSGFIVGYVNRLPDKYGQDKVDWLMNANYERRFDIEYAKRIKRIFGKRARLYKKLFRDLD